MAAGEISRGKLHSATFYLPQKYKQPFPTFPSGLFQSSLLWNMQCLLHRPPCSSCREAAPKVRPHVKKKNSFSVYMFNFINMWCLAPQKKVQGYARYGLMSAQAKQFCIIFEVGKMEHVHLGHTETNFDQVMRISCIHVPFVAFGALKG